MASRILVVEDNLMVAMLAEELLAECGCATVGPVGKLDEALVNARSDDFDGAILDVNLGTARVWPVAELLEARSIPFIIATGYGMDEVPERFRRHSVLTKPYTLDALRDALSSSGITAIGKTSEHIHS